jgi:serine protease Do
MQSSNRYQSGLWSKLRGSRMAGTFALLAVLTVGVVAGSMLTGSVSAKQLHVDSTDARPILIPNPVTLSNGFAAIVKEDGPAVVNINTESLPKAPATSKRGNRRLQPQDPNGEDGGGDQGDMQDWLNRFFGGQGGGQAPETGARHALGSGFIVDSRGYIITNNHVVDQADHIYVKLSTDPDDGDNGRPATLVGVDKETDIAVIKIDGKGLNLPTVKLGNSDGPEVGDWVLAIGSPLGQRNTVSAGIISAKNRSGDALEGPSPSGVSQSQFQKFIQTDAAINPGNSGGPLVDLSGSVVGMNTAILTQSQGSEGIGFAIPSNTIASVYNQLIGPEHKVTRGSIGISFQAAAASSAAVGRVYGFSNGGVIVSAVTPGAPAAKAGLQAQDVIVSVDGKSIKDGDELVTIVSAKHPGETVKVGYLRDKKMEYATVGITDRAKLLADAGTASDDSSSGDTSDVGQSTLGITVQPVTPAQASKLKVPSGVIVTSVKPGSFADEINLPKGVVITEINRKPVTDEASYRSIVSGLKSGEDVVFVVHVPGAQGGGSNYVGGTLP